MAAEVASSALAGRVEVRVDGVELALQLFQVARFLERLAREAYLKTLDVEELKQQLETVNPDPYAPDEAGTKNIGRFRNN